MPAKLPLSRYLPFLRWWPQVNRDTLRADLLAGLVGAIVVLPQGVAFATLAGLPPAYGLYAAMIPTAIAALFGSSLHAVTGPTNAVSLVVVATLASLAVPGSPEYVTLALTLSFLCGAMMLAMGLARLGVLANFISHTVVVGFTAGAALLIVASQLGNFFGLDLPRGASFLGTLRAFLAHVAELDPRAVLVGAATLAAGLLARRLAPKIPYMIVAMIAGSLVALALDRVLGETASAIRTLGALPSALPALSQPRFSLDTVQKLAGIAVAITVLVLTEAMSIARSIALRSGQRIDGNQEFIGQGLANVAASFFSAYPVAASFNRSGINYEAGASTPLAAVTAALLLSPILFGIAPLLAYLPIAALAAILFMVAWGLLDFDAMRVIARTSRSETALLALTFAATLLMELEFAILAGVTMSLLMYLARTSRPKMRSLAPDPEQPKRQLTEVAPGIAECPQLKILRVEGSLYFGAVDHVGTHLDTLREILPGHRHLLLMSKSINFVDVAGAELLRHEAQRRREAGGRLYLYGLRQPVRDSLVRGRQMSQIGEENVFVSKRDAITQIFGRLDRSVCARCRSRIFRECAALPPPLDDVSR